MEEVVQRAAPWLRLMESDCGMELADYFVALDIRIESAEGVARERLVPPRVYPEAFAEVLHELGRFWYDCEVGVEDRVGFIEAMFERYPYYSVLAGWAADLHCCGQGVREEAWRFFRVQLSSRSALKALAVKEVLTCEVFGEQVMEEEAFLAMGRRTPSPVMLARLLGLSAAIPWRLKKPIIDAAILNPDLHGAVLECVESCLDDLLGDYDPDAARSALQRLSFEASSKAAWIRSWLLDRLE